MTNPGNQTNTVGDSVNLAIVASDPDLDTLSYSATGLPAGLNINSSTGVIAGTPTTAGTSNVTVTVDDGNGGTDNANFTWTVEAAPVVTFYRDFDYAGVSWQVTEGVYDFNAVSNSPVGNDAISSIEIDPGYTVRVCQDSNGGGICNTYTSSVPQLFILNDQISHIEITTGSSGLAINDFTLVNTVTDADIGPLTNGTVIDLGTPPGGDITVRANPSTAPGSVVFTLNGSFFKNENLAPYAIVGDTNGDYAPWNPAPGNYTLTATPYSGADGTGTAGTPLTVNFTVEAAAIVCTTYSSTDIPKALPNGTTSITSNLPVNNNGTITDVDVTIDMAHAWVGDLSFALTHPNASTSVTVIDQPGVPTSNYGCSGDNILATLDDAASLPVENQCGSTAPTINGTFTPNNALSTFNGLNANGTWVLTVEDNYTSADSGTLNAWEIRVCTQQ